MNRTKNCKYCHETFTPRRRNHLYCTSSCKTMASYKRNNYTYMAGHYQKQQLMKPETALIPASIETKVAVPTIEERVEKMSKLNVPSITNAALGSLAASTAINGAKRLFAPNSLPATKGDIDTLKNDIKELKQLIYNNKSGFDIY